MSGLSDVVLKNKSPPKSQNQFCLFEIQIETGHFFFFFFTKQLLYGFLEGFYSGIIHQTVLILGERHSEKVYYQSEVKVGCGQRLSITDVAAIEELWVPQRKILVNSF